MENLFAIKETLCSNLEVISLEHLGTEIQLTVCSFSSCMQLFPVGLNWHEWNYSMTKSVTGFKLMMCC